METKKDGKLVSTVKTVLTVMSTVGCSTLIAKASKRIVPLPGGKIVSACTMIGTVALGGICGAAASKFYSDQVDTVVEAVDTITGKEDEPEVETIEE